MNDSKEFLGKTLDAAIAEACAYYDVPREKLEIDIIEDAKTGIFGIVGARKAKIQARLATLPDFMRLGFTSSPKPEREGRRNRKERRREKSEEQILTFAEQEIPAEPVETEKPVQPEALKQEKPAEVPAPELPAVEAEPVAEPEKAEAVEEENPRGRKGRKERPPRQPRREPAPP